MTDSTIVLLPTLSSLSGTEVTYVVSGGIDYQTTTQAIADLGGGGGGGGVPYTGATNDVDLGTHSISAQSMLVTGTNGNGHLHLKHQASDATATGSSTALFANSSGDLKWKNASNFYTTLTTSANTASRAYTFPDASGTLTITTDIAELAQDAVGGILTDTSTIDFSYSDATPSITADVKDSSITTTKLGGDITTAGKALLDDADASAQRTTLSAATRSQQVVAEISLPVGDNVTRNILSKSAFALTIDSFNGVSTDSGTITAAIKINGTNVTGMSAISITSTPQDVTATAANTISIGDKVTIVFSSNSSAVNVAGTLYLTRTLA